MNRIDKSEQMLRVDASAFAVAAAVLFAARGASAISGVIEISQAGVLKNGGHFPYWITAPGSYRLTSNLDVTADTGNIEAAANRHAIIVSASDVVIDLNGFALLGPLVCSNATLGCSPFPGAGDGVALSSRMLTNITVRNGSVRGLGADGIDLGVFDGNSRVDHVHASSNGRMGIEAGVVVGCSATSNYGYGIYANVIRDSVAVDNVFPGLGGSKFLSSSYSKGNDGLQTEYLGGNNGYGVVSGNTLLGGDVAAFRYGGSPLFSENLLTRSSSVFPLSEGAPAVDGSGAAAYRRNLLASPVDPVIRGGATQLGLNLCNGETVCP